MEKLNLLSKIQKNELIGGIEQDEVNLNPSCVVVNEALNGIQTLSVHLY